jgi:NADH-quinone oxidoreductase subunit N
MAVMFVVAEEGDSLADFDGLARRRPWVAWVTMLLLLSLIGVPPLAGFTGKLFLFGSAVGAGLTWLALFAVIMSAVSAGFYFRIVRAMFFARGSEESAGEDAGAEVSESIEPAAETERPAHSPVAAAMLVACAALVVVIGIWSGPLLAALGLVLR